MSRQCYFFCIDLVAVVNMNFSNIFSGFIIFRHAKYIAAAQTAHLAVFNNNVMRHCSIVNGIGMHILFFTVNNSIEQNERLFVI